MYLTAEMEKFLIDNSNTKGSDGKWRSPEGDILTESQLQQIINSMPEGGSTEVNRQAAEAGASANELGLRDVSRAKDQYEILVTKAIAEGNQLNPGWGDRLGEALNGLLSTGDPHAYRAYLEQAVPDAFDRSFMYRVQTGLGIGQGSDIATQNKFMQLSREASNATIHLRQQVFRVQQLGISTDNNPDIKELVDQMTSTDDRPWWDHGSGTGTGAGAFNNDLFGGRISGGDGKANTPQFDYGRGAVSDEERANALSGIRRAYEIQRRYLDDTGMSTEATPEIQRANYFARLADMENQRLRWKPSVGFYGAEGPAQMSQQGEVYQHPQFETEEQRLRDIGRNVYGAQLNYNEFERIKEADDVLRKMLYGEEVTINDIERLRVVNNEALRQMMNVSEAQLWAQLRNLEEQVEVKKILQAASAQMKIDLAKLNTIMTFFHTMGPYGGAIAAQYFGVQMPGILATVLTELVDPIVKNNRKRMREVLDSHGGIQRILDMIGVGVSTTQRSTIEQQSNQAATQ